MIRTKGFLRSASLTAGATATSSSFNVIGSHQYFDGQVSGKFTPGIVTINPVLIKRTLGTCDSVDINCRFRSGNRWYDWPVVGELAAAFGLNSAPIAPVPNLHVDCTVNKALAGLNKPALDVGLMLGELKETLHELRRPLNSLYPLVKEMRKNALSKTSRKSSSVSLSHTLSGAWLEYSYGIVPILNDIQSIRKYFTKKMNKSLTALQRSSASDIVTSKPIRTNGMLGDLINLYCYVQGSAESYSQRKVSTHIYYKANEWADNYATLTSLGLNPFQLVDVLYAITPYSFVVNWFYDIGTWLKALQPHPHLNLLGGCTTIKEIQACSVTTTMAQSYQGYSPWYPANSSWNYKTEQLTRVIRTSWSAPPTIGPGIDTFSKALNSVAMLWQRIPLKW